MYKGSWRTSHRIKVIKRQGNRKPHKHSGLVTAVQFVYSVNFYPFTVNTKKTSSVFCFLATNLCDIFISYESFLFRTTRWRLQSSGVTMENLWSFCPIFLSGITPTHTLASCSTVRTYYNSVIFSVIFASLNTKENCPFVISCTLKTQAG